MGLFKKMKDILFDEEVDYTEQIKITPEMRNEESPIREEKKEAVKEVRDNFVVKDIPKKEPIENVNDEVSESKTFKNDSTFPFWDFDEEEFTSQNVQVPKEEPARVVKQTFSNNILDYEKRKRYERKVDYPVHSRTESVDSIDKKKFKPSPVISPVYGILDKDYSKEDLITSSKEEKIDVQQVRDKAFGESKQAPKITRYEETEIVSVSNPIEKEKKVKTIDELLENTSDYVVDIDRDLEDTIEAKIPSSIDNPFAKKQPMKTVNEEIPKAPLQESEESDLFDLIDQMYDNKEND